MTVTVDPSELSTVYANFTAGQRFLTRPFNFADFNTLNCAPNQTLTDIFEHPEDPCFPTIVAPSGIRALKSLDAVWASCAFVADVRDPPRPLVSTSALETTTALAKHTFHTPPAPSARASHVAATTAPLAEPALATISSSSSKPQLMSPLKDEPLGRTGENKSKTPKQTSDRDTQHTSKPPALHEVILYSTISVKDKPKAPRVQITVDSLQPLVSWERSPPALESLPVSSRRNSLPPKNRPQPQMDSKLSVLLDHESVAVPVLQPILNPSLPNVRPKPTTAPSLQPDSPGAHSLTTTLPAGPFISQLAPVIAQHSTLTTSNTTTPQPSPLKQSSPSTNIQSRTTILSTQDASADEAHIDTSTLPAGPFINQLAPALGQAPPLTSWLLKETGALQSAAAPDPATLSPKGASSTSSSFTRTAELPDGSAASHSAPVLAQGSTWSSSSSAALEITQGNTQPPFAELSPAHRSSASQSHSRTFISPAGPLISQLAPVLAQTLGSPTLPPVSPPATQKIGSSSVEAVSNPEGPLTKADSSAVKVDSRLSSAPAGSFKSVTAPLPGHDLTSVFLPSQATGITQNEDTAAWSTLARGSDWEGVPRADKARLQGPAVLDPAAVAKFSTSKHSNRGTAVTALNQPEIEFHRSVPGNEPPMDLPASPTPEVTRTMTAAQGQTSNTLSLVSTSGAEKSVRIPDIPIITLSDSDVSFELSTLSRRPSTGEPAISPASTIPVSASSAAGAPLPSRGTLNPLPSSSEASNSFTPIKFVSPAVLKLAVGSQTIAVDESGVVVAGHSLELGSQATTLGSVRFSLGSSAFIIGDQTKTLQDVSKTPTNDPAAALVSGLQQIGGGVIHTKTTPSAFELGGKILTVNSDNVIVTGHSLMRVDTTTPISGTAFASGTSNFVISSETAPSINPSAMSNPDASLIAGLQNIGATLMRPATTASAAAVSDEIITVNPSNMIVAGHTLGPGRSGVEISGTTMSLGSSQIVVTKTEQFTASHSSPAFPVLAVIQETFTTDPTDMVIASQTLKAGSPAITISGTPIYLGSSKLVAGTRTESYKIRPSKSTIQGAALVSGLDQLSASLISVGTIPYFTVAGDTFTVSPSGILVVGHTLVPGGTGIDLSGTVVSLGTSDIVVGTRTGALTGSVTPRTTSEIPHAVNSSASTDVQGSERSLTSGTTSSTARTHANNGNAQKPPTFFMMGTVLFSFFMILSDISGRIWRAPWY